MVSRIQVRATPALGKTSGVWLFDGQHEARLDARRPDDVGNDVEANADEQRGDRGDPMEAALLRTKAGRVLPEGDDDHHQHGGEEER